METSPGRLPRRALDTVRGMSLLDPAAALAHSDSVWEDSVLPALARYIAIPNRSPAFDPRWREHGHMERAVALVAEWCRARPVPGLTLEVVRLPSRTPLIWLELPGATRETVLVYGHLDKQPEMTGWSDGLGPWTPVRRGDRLYGRGGADDGYAAFAAVTALELLARAGARHARCVVLIEACEESGSGDLPAYVDHLASRIGQPSLVVALDSGCGNYEQLWGTTSLRGMVTGTLRVDILREGVHSGDASGVVPSSFRILRALLSRLEDERTGELRVPALHAAIPPDRAAQATAAADVLGENVWERFPFVEGARPMGERAADRILARTWKPTLSVTGIDGIPAPGSAGNVLRPYTAAKLSLRIPPTTSGEAATAVVKRLLEEDPPYGARVSFHPEVPGQGWNAPAFAPWLERAMADASSAYWGKPAVFMGEGGTIPFMGMLGARFPRAQFLITGVLGPGANAHGPNEFLHIPSAKRLTCAVARVLEAHAEAHP
jgi:acetylornithine deacetylase/succinyl-diaminopimelate desuccinylase-like protein